MQFLSYIFKNFPGWYPEAPPLRLLRHRSFRPVDVRLAPILLEDRDIAKNYVRIGPQSEPYYLLGSTSIVPMAYEEMLAYETLNVDCDYKRRTFFIPSTTLLVKIGLRFEKC